MSKLLKYIICLCLSLTLQTGWVCFGQHVKLTDYQTVSDHNTSQAFAPYSTEYNKPFSMLKSPPDGETDPEIIGVDQAPVEESLVAFLLLVGTYIIFNTKRRELRAENN